MSGKWLMFCLAFLSAPMLNAQDSLAWHFYGEIPIASNDTWSVDVLENIYVVSDKNLTKYDSTMKVSFTQSIKSLGRLSACEPMNTMKVIAFSEEQQSVCVLDNTLTLSEACIDLSLYDVFNATQIAVSSQPDKLWVFDQLNSRLLLLSLGSIKQSQEVGNMQGITGIGEAVKMEENQNELYISDRLGQIFVFDVYGTLKWTVGKSEMTDFTVHDGYLVRIVGDKIMIHKGGEEMLDPRNLPIAGIKELHISSGFYYFRTADKILKYSVSWR
jgi:hypothetical protein